MAPPGTALRGQLEWRGDVRVVPLEDTVYGSRRLANGPVIRRALFAPWRSATSDAGGRRYIERPEVYIARQSGLVPRRRGEARRGDSFGVDLIIGHSSPIAVRRVIRYRKGRAASVTASTCRRERGELKCNNIVRSRSSRALASSETTLMPRGHPRGARDV